MLDNFVDRAKELLMYRFEGGEDTVKSMLTMDDEANSRLNLDMAKFEIALERIDSNWRGNWHRLFSKDFGHQLERANLTLNGYARTQAIEMQGQHTVAQREVLEKKDRAGILSLFSGGK